MKRTIPVTLWAKDELIQQLYRPARQYLSYKLDDIIKSNNLAHNDGHVDGKMRYKAVAYESSHKARMVMPSSRFVTQYDLAEDLHEPMEEWLKEALTLTEEEFQVKRFLSILLAKLKNFSDLEQVLGDNICGMISEHKKMFRSPELDTEELMITAKEAKPYVEMMQNRLIDNLISKDLFSD
jgi:hypothetical protein